MNIIFLFIFQVVTLKYVNAYHKEYMMAYIPIEEFIYLTSAGFDMIPVPQYSSPLAYGQPWIQESLYHQSWFPGYFPPAGHGGYSYGSGSIGAFGSPGYLSNPSLITTPSSLPTITSLPPVSLPRPPVVPPPMPSTFPAISTVTTLSDASAVKEPLSFNGKVKASGGVKIYANFF